MRLPRALHIKVAALSLIGILFSMDSIASSVKSDNNQRCAASGLSLLDERPFSVEIAAAAKDAPNIIRSLGVTRRAQLKRLLALGENPNVCWMGSSALNLSAVTGDRDEVMLLLNAGAKLDIPLDEAGGTPLLASLTMGKYAVAELLLERGANPKHRDDLGSSALHQLATYSVEVPAQIRNQQIKMAERLLAFGVPIDAQSNIGITPLMYAVLAHNKELVAYFLAHNADPNLQDKRGQSAIGIAKKLKDKIILDMLEQNSFVRLLRRSETAEFVRLFDGCKQPNAKVLADRLLVFALTRANREAMLALIKCGADINQVNDIDISEKTSRLTLLAFAAGELGNQDMVAALVEAGADINKASTTADNQIQFSTLNAALSKHHTQIASYLIEHGARVNFADSNTGMTPLMFTVSLGNEESALRASMLAVAKLLIAHGADLEQRSRGGMTALHYASIVGDSAAIELLLAHGANPNVVDDLKRTPLFYAKKSSDKATIKLFDSTKKSTQ